MRKIVSPNPVESQILVEALRQDKVMAQLFRQKHEILSVAKVEPLMGHDGFFIMFVHDTTSLQAIAIIDKQISDRMDSMYGQLLIKNAETMEV
jgi:hypothetical protein